MIEAGKTAVTWNAEPTVERSWTTPSTTGGLGKGPSERLIVPSFSGDIENGGDLGSSARSYLRQVSAWEKMTKLAPDQRALVLYQHLAGSAWVNSESLSVDELARPDGVDRLREWVRQHYLDVEVTQVGRSLSDLFRKLRRRPTQSFRDYAAEFNRLLARVVECGCALPDVANAWLFVDRANLDEATEVSLLASVLNKYALKALQSAAIVLDRSMRKPWEKGATRGRPQNVNHAEDVPEGNDTDTDVEGPTFDDPHVDAGDLYVSYMTAKARYKEAAKSRGVDTKGNDKNKEVDATNARRAAESKIALAKAKSHCSACGQKGHWHRDEICPKFGKNSAGTKPNTIHVTNEVYELIYGGAHDLLAILDTACSKTVVGTSWLQKYLDHTKGGGYDADFIRERESFKFGAASKIYESSYAVVIFIPIASQVVAVKASVIHGDVPLLMSKPALTRLGLILDLGRSVATFRELQSGEIVLLETHSGHPALKIDHADMAKPDLSKLPTSWENHGVEIFSERAVYMVSCCGDEQVNGSGPDIVPKIFYDKKIDGTIRDMLTSDVLNEELFSVWWATTEIKNDFWLELPHKLIRVHVTPRRKFFDPRRWETSQTHLRDLLLAQLGSMRETWGVGCLSSRMLSTVSELWQDRELGDYPTLWVGRSVFNRAQAPLVPGPPGHGCSMADDKRAVDCGVQQARAGNQQGLDMPGASDSSPGRHGVREEEQGGHRPEGPKGLSGMNLGELREEAKRLNLEVGPRDTKGSLMLRIRDAAAPATTVMTVGRFRGSPFGEIPDAYGAWASEEERQNGANMHVDLKRFVMWRRHARNAEKTEKKPAKSTPNYLDVETYASV